MWLQLVTGWSKAQLVKGDSRQLQLVKEAVSLISLIEADLGGFKSVWCLVPTGHSNSSRLTLVS